MDYPDLEETQEDQVQILIPRKKPRGKNIYQLYAHILNNKHQLWALDSCLGRLC